MVPLSFGCGSAVLAAIATLAPSRAARSAMARPMPRLAPDTNSVLPLRDVMRGLRSSQWMRGRTILRRWRDQANRPPRNPSLLPCRFRAAGPRIGSAEQAVGRDGDRVGGGLA